MTGRAHIYKVLQNQDGSVMLGATVQVLEEDSSSAFTGTLYTTSGGGSSMSNPFTCTDGIIEFYIDVPQRLGFAVTPTNAGEFYDTIDGYPRAEDIVVADVPNLSLGTPVNGYVPQVNDSGQFEYVDPSTFGGGGGGGYTPPPYDEWESITTDATTGFTTDKYDAGQIVKTTAATTVTVSVTAWEHGATGDCLVFFQSGAGQINFVGGSGSSVETQAGSQTKTAGQGAVVILRYLGGGNWVLYGGVYTPAATGPGQTSEDPITTFYMEDSDNVVWAVTIDTDGRIDTNALG